MAFERILVTGAAGFIGAAFSKYLLKKGHKVIGIDNLNNYYDVKLKEARLKNIINDKNLSNNWIFITLSIENKKALEKVFKDHNPEVVVNLAAQAGVRNSIKNPSDYIQSNILGFGNILEICKDYEIKNLVYASSSSVYGANEKLPYKENHGVDHPVSLYAATKRSNELMAHTYSHIYKLPSTGLRFFTVYGPWGRPDMAPIIFTESIMNKKPIKLFNNGNMVRDFTYIDDIVESIYRCCLKPATTEVDFNKKKPNPDSSFAPYKIFNIGNGVPTKLIDFIEILENALGIKAIKKLEPMQLGDVKSTAASTSNLQKWINYKPKTPVEDGIKKFVNWYKKFYL